MGKVGSLQAGGRVWGKRPVSGLSQSPLGFRGFEAQGDGTYPHAGSAERADV